MARYQGRMWPSLVFSGLGCRPSEPLPTPEDSSSVPSWAQQDGARLTARCADHDLHVDALQDGMVRLQYVRPGEAPDRRSFAVQERLPAEPTFGGDAESAWMSTPELSVRVDAACRVQVLDAQGAVLLEDGPSGGFFDEGDRVGVRRATPPDERFYGAGERTGPLQKRGSHVVFRNTDAYDPIWGGYRPDQDPLYVSIPFFLSLRSGRAAGVFTDVPFRSELDLARDDTSAWSWVAEGDRIDQYVIAGPQMSEVLRRYTALVGRPARPPLWTLGYHQCRWGYWPDTRLVELADTFRSKRIPADGLWLDIQHMDGYRTFTFDPVGFPDPAWLMDTLHARGFGVVAIADPGLKEEPGWPIWDEAVSGDHLLRRPDGSLFIGTVWPGPSGFPDFSRPETRAFWGGHIGELAAIGLDGIWLDVNEPTTFPEGGAGLSVDDDVLAHGEGLSTTMAEVHNVYGQLEAQATVEGLVQARPERRPFVLSRAGYAGIQRYAATWTGDVPSTWEGLSLTLPMMLGLGLSGQPFTGSDVGGYSGRDPDGNPTSPELFVRWMEVGVLSPLLRGHVTSGAIDQEPWAFGQEVEDISRLQLDWRYRALPYLYSLHDEAVLTGAPLLRPLVWEFPDDTRTYELGDQAMLGPWLLAAPVLASGAGTRRVVLPAGRWYELHSGAIWEGPDEIEVGVTLQALPMFVREGAILPLAPSGRQHTGDPGDGSLMLDLYPSDEPSSFVLYEDAGDGAGPWRRTTLSLEGTATGARLLAQPEGDHDPGPRTLRLRLRRADHGVDAVRLDGEALPAGQYGWDERDLSVWIELVDPGAFELEVDYDRSVTELRPPVDIELVVTVPEGTPADPPVHVASSANGWVHTPLVWDPVDPRRAVGTLTVPRGEWYLFKYSRGDWCTVEKYPDCVEANDRYALGAAGLDREDVVYGWRDWCEPCE
jgi:alpha-glucosidase